MKHLALSMAALALAACSPEQPAAPAPEAAPETAAEGADANVVATAYGLVRGEAADGLRVFRGIPYAAPPMGDLRWRAPAPPAKWEGTRDALSFGTPCWQPILAEGFYSRGNIERSEDCLYLNVWTRGQAGDDLPVMVWIHGGALRIGHGHLPMYDGGALTARGVVLVSINYRLGPLGFLAHPGLSAESERGVSGNYGIQDQIAALAWVRDNIAAFGGNPGNVTILGESAGSLSVCCLYASPLAKGLFHRAIGQSGGCFAPHLALAGASPDEDSGHAVGERFAAMLEAPDVAALRRMSAEAIYEKAGMGPEGRIVYADGYVFPAQMSELVASGAHNRVPVLVGANADEGTTLFPDAGDDEAAWNEAVAAWGEQAGAIRAAYAADVARGWKTASQQLASDAIFAWEMRTWARANAAHGDPAWLYHFTHAPDVGEGYGTSLGAFHAAEIPYVFGNPHLGFGKAPPAPRPSDLEVSRLMISYWTNFAKTGNPNGDGLPEWPSYDAETDLALEISAAPKTIAGLGKEKLDAMDAFYSGR